MVVLEKLQEEENLASTKTMFGSGDIPYGRLCHSLTKLECLKHIQKLHHLPYLQVLHWSGKPSMQGRQMRYSIMRSTDQNNPLILTKNAAKH